MDGLSNLLRVFDVICRAILKINTLNKFEWGFLLGFGNNFGPAGHLVFLRPCPAVLDGDVYALHRLGKVFHCETKIIFRIA